MKEHIATLTSKKMKKVGPTIEINENQFFIDIYLYQKLFMI